MDEHGQGDHGQAKSLLVVLLQNGRTVPTPAGGNRGDRPLRTTETFGLLGDRRSCGPTMRPPVRHGGRLLVDEFLGRRDKHADCAGRGQQAGLGRTCGGRKGKRRLLERVVNCMLNKGFTGKKRVLFD